MDKKKITAYKGFDKDFKCLGFQYEVGREYVTDKVKCCESGFHACENPFDVWDYYNITGSRFALVEQSGKIVREEDKTCSSKICIKEEIGLGDFIHTSVGWIVSKTRFETDCNVSSGNYAQIGSSGNSAQIGSSGNYAKIGSSGYSAQIGSSGNYAQIGSSGDSAKIGSSGDSAKIGSSGDCVQIKSEGKNCVICCAGNKSAARAKKGSWITLSEWGYIDDEWVPVCVKTERVDGVRIKEDTWYKLKNGEFVETEQED